MKLRLVPIALLQSGNHPFWSYVSQYGYPTLVFIDKGQYIREVVGYTDVSALNAKIDDISQY